MYGFCSILYLVVVWVLGGGVVVSVAYLLLLLTAAAASHTGGRRRDTRPTKAAAPPPASGSGFLAARPRLAVVVPAHNEEMVLAATLDSLNAQDYPAERYEVIVVADNCTDTTARIARQRSATVLERVNLLERGKGFALEWAFTRLMDRPDPADAFVIIDADTYVSPDFLSQAASGLARAADTRGCIALQGRYGVLNAGDGWRAALMAAAFDLFNHVRPLGRDRLGMSVGLKGNGMVFSHALLAEARWCGDSVTEDIDFWIALIRDHGVRVGYLPQARILAQMPVTGAQAASQRKRWEEGRRQLLREQALPLLALGLRRRSLTLCEAAFNLMLPPLAELSVLLLLWAGLLGAGAALHLLPASRSWLTVARACAAGLVGYVLGGLVVAGASRRAYAALLLAPFYALWKFLLYCRSSCRFASRQFGRGTARGQAEAPAEWVRTDRLPLAPNPAEAPPGLKRTGPGLKRTGT